MTACDFSRYFYSERLTPRLGSGQVTYGGGVSLMAWFGRHRVATDVAIAVFFVLLDAVDTLVGGSCHGARKDWLLYISADGHALTLEFRDVFDVDEFTHSGYVSSSSKR